MLFPGRGPRSRERRCAGRPGAARAAAGCIRRASGPARATTPWSARRRRVRPGPAARPGGRRTARAAVAGPGPALPALAPPTYCCGRKAGAGSSRGHRHRRRHSHRCSLLERLTAWPPLGAAAVSVAVQLSVPAPVIDPLAQVSALTLPCVVVLALSVMA